MKEEYLRYVIPVYANKRVESNQCLRCRMAQVQQKFEKVSYSQIIEYVEEFLEKLGITHQTDAYYNLKEKPIKRGFYYNIKRDNPGMKDKRDIIWMKFTNTGHLGVVASSADVNFRMSNTSGKIIAAVGETWNDEYVLIFPLENIPKGWNRHMVESAVGNYLIKKGVPILDYYSHNV